MIRDVIDIVKQVQDVGANSDTFTSRLLKPASARPTVFKNASGMIAYFPILVSENVNFEQLEKIRIGLEAEYAGYLGLAINAKSSLTGETSTASGVLSLVHSNELPTKGLNIDYSAVRSLINESVVLDSRTLGEDMNLNLLEAKNLPHETTINAEEGTSIKIDNSSHKTTINGPKTPKAKTAAEIREIESKIAENQSRINANNTATSGREAQAHATSNSRTSKMGVSKRESANQTAPSLINISIPLTNGGQMDATYGVKCQIHTLAEGEIKKYTAETIKKKSMAFRLIQWYTGELKMWKDIILNTNDNKKLALSSPWWKFLYNNAKINKFKAFIRNEYLMIPNATLILTEDQVTSIFREYGVDVMKNAGVLINELFLARFIVLDEAGSTLNIYDERAKSFQRITIQSIYVDKDSSRIEDLFKNIR